jgi:hypothetical protein
VTRIIHRFDSYTAYFGENLLIASAKNMLFARFEHVVERLGGCLQSNITGVRFPPCSLMRKGFDREKEEQRISQLSNRFLYEETFELAGGDDYDGCFTAEGIIKFEMLQKELVDRLQDWFGDE